MQHVFFQAILPIYKFPKIIRGPNIKERGPIDGNLVPSEYFRCQNLITRVGKIEMSMTWKDQVLNLQDLSLKFCFYKQKHKFF